MDIQDGNAKFAVRSMVKSVNGKYADGNGNIQLYNGLTTLTALLDAIYPVGSIKITVNATAPFKSLNFGTWTEVGKGRVLWGGDNAGSTIEAGLPNIGGTFHADGQSGRAVTGGFAVDRTAEYALKTNTGDKGTGATYSFWASRSNAIYGKSNTVQPPAYVVHFWQRTK